MEEEEGKSCVGDVECLDRPASLVPAAIAACLCHCPLLTNLHTCCSTLDSTVFEECKTLEEQL